MRDFSSDSSQLLIRLELILILRFSNLVRLGIIAFHGLISIGLICVSQNKVFIDAFYLGASERIASQPVAKRRYFFAQYPETHCEKNCPSIPQKYRSGTPKFYPCFPFAIGVQGRAGKLPCKSQLSRERIERGG